MAVSFDTIPHAALMDRVREKVADGRVLGLLEALLTQKVMETAEGWAPEEGTLQGAVISLLLSNVYLNPLDHLMEENGGGDGEIPGSRQSGELCPNDGLLL